MDDFSCVLTPCVLQGHDSYTCFPRNAKTRDERVFTKVSNGGNRLVYLITLA